jgi:nitroreductase
MERLRRQSDKIIGTGDYGGLRLDLFEAIRLRRSTRAFTDEEVSDEEVNRLLEAARWAPSAGNIQPWSYVVVRKAETKKRLAEAALDQFFIKEAPVVIVVCADENRSGQGYGRRGVFLYCIQDAAAATENILLAACALGLGTCWVGAFREDEVRVILSVPRGLRPVAIVPIGHPAEGPCPRYKRSLKEMVHYETF